VIKIDVQDIHDAHPTAAHAVAHAMRAVEALLAMPEFFVPLGENRIYFELMRDLPYQVHEADSFMDTQLLVNRHYKPVGNAARSGEGWSRYEEQANLHVKLTAAQIAELSTPLRPGWLFSDADAPWKGRASAEAYLERLKALAALLR
jgi:hypothetical protein